MEVDEDAGQRAREELRAQQAVGVDDGAPRPADAPGHGEVPLREAAEDVGEYAVRQQRRQVRRMIHGSELRAIGEIKPRQQVDNDNDDEMIF